MQKNFVKVEQRRIENKRYLVPVYNLENFEQYLLPKLEFKGTQHVYFNPHDIDQLYKENNLDPQNLECNLKYQPGDEKKLAEEKKTQEEKLNAAKEQKEEAREVGKVEVKMRPRPALPEKGFTHFVHVPFVDACREIYENIIKTQIDPNDLDSLVDLKTLHATIMVFRPRSLDDLPKWQTILKSLKLRKVKVTIRGIGIFPVKVNTNYTRVLFIKVDGLDEVIHEVVRKAIEQGLVNEKELSNIVFDKKTDMYRAEQQHLTILKTKGKDIIDATQYLKTFSKLNLGKVPLSDIRLSMIGSFDGQDYFNEYIVPADK